MGCNYSSTSYCTACLAKLSLNFGYVWGWISRSLRQMWFLVYTLIPPLIFVLAKLNSISKSDPEIDFHNNDLDCIYHFSVMNPRCYLKEPSHYLNQNWHIIMCTVAFAWGQFHKKYSVTCILKALPHLTQPNFLVNSCDLCRHTLLVPSPWLWKSHKLSKYKIKHQGGSLGMIYVRLTSSKS